LSLNTQAIVVPVAHNPKYWIISMSKVTYRKNATWTIGVRQAKLTYSV